MDSEEWAWNDGPEHPIDKADKRATEHLLRTLEWVMKKEQERRELYEQEK